MNTAIKNAISTLKNQERIFHSEDDLKFAFSLSIKDTLPPDVNIRLEKPEEITMVYRNSECKKVRAPIDIVLMRQDGLSIPIELKYKTRKLNTEYCGEHFNLADHGATDTGRFDIRKDIYRIEQFLKTSEQSNAPGYVIIITNDSDYMKDISTKNRLDSRLSMHNSAVLSAQDPGWNYDVIDKNIYTYNSDSCKWVYKDNNNKSHWTCKGDYFFRLDLINDYNITWHDYLHFDNGSIVSSFYYAIIGVTS